jgi:hypothetical protein
MGDHRFNFKATFEMHGVKGSCDMWLNWSPRDGEVDHRIIEWISGLAMQAMDKWHAEVEDNRAQQRAEEIERAERAEYERLKAKFDGP